MPDVVLLVAIKEGGCTIGGSNREQKVLGFCDSSQATAVINDLAAGGDLIGWDFVETTPVPTRTPRFVEYGGFSLGGHRYEAPPWRSTVRRQRD